jgi:hypothetical protein
VRVRWSRLRARQSRTGPPSVLTRARGRGGGGTGRLESRWLVHWHGYPACEATWEPWEVFTKTNGSVPLITVFENGRQRAKQQALVKQKDESKAVVACFFAAGLRMHAHCRHAYSHEGVRAFRNAMYSTDTRKVSVPCETRTARLFQPPVRCARYTATKIEFECGTDLFDWMRLNGQLLTREDVGERREPRVLCDGMGVHDFTTYHVAAEGAFPDGTLVKIITRLDDGRLKIKSAGRVCVYNPDSGMITVAKPITVRYAAARPPLTQPLPPLRILTPPSPSRFRSNLMWIEFYVAAVNGIDDGYLGVDESDDNGENEINAIVELWWGAPNPAEINDQSNRAKKLQLYVALVGPGAHARPPCLHTHTRARTKTQYTKT